MKPKIRAQLYYRAQAIAIKPGEILNYSLELLYLFILLLYRYTWGYKDDGIQRRQDSIIKKVI